MKAPERRPIVLITGAAGNLGGMLARHLLPLGWPLRLMYHRRPLPAELLAAPQVTAVRADLAVPATLRPAVTGVDVVVHFAGVLFAPRPERFLRRTNAGFFHNLLGAALAAGVGRMILISFPHVEGPTSFVHPATGRLDHRPISVHARTRLQEERELLQATAGTHTTPVVLRLGMVYGRGVLMIDVARWLARRRLLAVWREPTWIQLIAVADYLRAVTAAIQNQGIRGSYHVGDERPQTLQGFLDAACAVWGCAPPWRLPLGLIETAALGCEAAAGLMGWPAPLTRDFLRIGRVSYWGDTRRARAELIPELVYPDLEAGRGTL